MIRVAIREQLAALVVFAVLIALAIVSIPTWIFVHNFVVTVESGGLSLTASLKAARIGSQLDLLQTTCESVATRILIQEAFVTFYDGNTSLSNWAAAAQDLEGALSSGGFSPLLQARLYSRNTTGNPDGIFSVTGKDVPPIRMPYDAPDGAPAYLDNSTYGYPPTLFPNITYTDTGQPNPYLNSTDSFTASPFPDVLISNNGGLVLGPLIINQTYALITLTVPVYSNIIENFILGYMTLAASAGSLIDVQLSQEGLGSTGVVLVVGPSNPYNRFNVSDPASNATYKPNTGTFQDTLVHFILPPIPAPDGQDRHTEHDYASGEYDESFPVKQYPAVLNSFAHRYRTVNNASSILSTTNEQGWSVAVGFARPQSNLVNWTVLVEQAKSEAYAPITDLQHILLGTVFGTTGVILLLIIPCAHYSVLPIRRLKAATEKSVAPPGYTDGLGGESDSPDQEEVGCGTTPHRSEKGISGAVARFRRAVKRRYWIKPDHDLVRGVFKIPGKVLDRKQHLITDELTELTTTFNEMSDELYRQYTSLEERVAERTKELEISKKAAEAANESKTLFIANISHELKTPLNGIMGMCSYCMAEDDLEKIKASLKTLYKSGDLLLHLLEDLLSFSKNQIGQQVSLEEREFRLGDIRSQTISIFDKQAREGKIAFSVTFIGGDVLPDGSHSPEGTGIDRRLPALGPAGAGRLKDMCLWGDQHRILQVIINLVSNSLKFTPPGGRVDVRIRCVGEAEQSSKDESRTSSFSRSGSGRAARNRHGVGSSSNQSQASSKDVPALGPPYDIKGGTAIAINPMESKVLPHAHVNERSPTPPPQHARGYVFEFEVQDTGPGIPGHMQQRVFEPFVQGDLGLSRKHGGTGLGLSICQQLAHLMGGNISIQSTVGVGSTFAMQIPLRYARDRASSTASSSVKSRTASLASTTVGDATRKPLPTTTGEGQSTAAVSGIVNDIQPRLVGLSLPFFATKPLPSPPPPSREDQQAAIEAELAAEKQRQGGPGRLRVLVADDNTINIDVASKMLRLEDIYDVAIARDGQEAYELVRENMARGLPCFDVIFMDIQMPNLDGLQSTRLIRQMGYSAPIVALTAFSEESNVRECMESGMNEFLAKPIKRPALKQVLKKFATIPEEEVETASLGRRATPPERPAAVDCVPAAAQAQQPRHPHQQQRRRRQQQHSPTPVPGPASERDPAKSGPRVTEVEGTQAKGSLPPSS